MNDDNIGMKDGQFLVRWRRGKVLRTVGDILRELANRGLRLPSHLVMTCYEAAQYQGKGVSEARRRFGDRARRQVKEWQDNPQPLTEADRAALAAYPDKYKRPFEKPKGTTFKRELKRFAVAHGRAVQAALKEQGKPATNMKAAEGAAKNLQRHSPDWYGDYKGMPDPVYIKLKEAIAKELGQNRV
jgi:hypothetical protein